MEDDPRNVRPRTRTYQRRPVIAVEDIHNWLYEDGSMGTGNLLTNLTTPLPDMPPTIFAKQGAADFVAQLDAYFRKTHPDSWQWRVTEQERAVMRPGGFHAASRITTTVHYFGFKNGAYHKILDPVTMYGQGLETIWPGEAPSLNRLLAWAITIRDFCDENGMDVRPTIGGIAGQYWTDRRFYPHARRKVPWRTNDRARQNLPGNHYALFVHPSPRYEFTADYLDQHRAHHYHARMLALPDANSLYAHGYFKTLEETVWDDIPEDFYGLYALDLEAPRTRRWRFLQSGTRFVFSNELPLLRDLGYRILGVRAAWGSNKQDRGVRRYAKYAESQLDRYGDAPWIKPLLLAAYGTLATRATYGETIFRLASKGDLATVRTGHHQLTGSMVRAPQKLEPKIANVIHRGMIEAATRADSIGLAEYLTGQGYRVLSIYADAVMVEHDDDKPLPDLPEPWRLKRTLNHLQFVSKQAFMSGEMTKLPGVGRELRQYARRSNGQAPEKPMYEAVTGRRVKSGRKI